MSLVGKSVQLKLSPRTADMAALEAEVRAIQKDGLLWGTSKLAPVGFGIKKLQITCVIEDAKVCSSRWAADGCTASSCLLRSCCNTLMHSRSRFMHGDTVRLLLAYTDDSGLAMSRAGRVDGRDHRGGAGA
jgi:translation elongation factor EF-1beta